MSNYIQNLCSASAAWSSPEPALLNDPMWFTRWESADTITRDNLAHGWLACWIENMNDMSQHETHNYIRSTYVSERDWFGKIASYIRPEALEQMGLPGYSSTLDILARDKTQNPDLSVLRKLWFGCANDRLQALAQIPLKRTFLQSFGPLVSALAWDAVRDSQSTSRDRGLAAVISIESSRGKVDSSYAIFSAGKEKMWFDLGEVTDAYQENPGRELVHRHYFNTVAQLDPQEAALPLRLLLSSSLRNTGTPKGMTVSPKTVIGVNCPDARPFEALRTWMPKCREIFNTCESLDMRYDEVLQYISDGVTVEKLALPTEELYPEV